MIILLKLNSSFTDYIRLRHCPSDTVYLIRYHGRGGYLDVTSPSYVSPLRECFLQAGEELGYDVIDYNSDRVIGFSTVQVHLRNGHRVSANKAFLRPIRLRKNLHLSKLSKVTKIIVDPKTKTAMGVEFVKNGKALFVSAKKEIILSAGTLQELLIFLNIPYGRQTVAKTLR